MNVGERIKKRRKELKYSVDYVAEAMGKNRATVYRYESNEIENMSLDIIVDLAKVLKVDPGYLMGWKNNQEDLVSSVEYDYFPVSISAGLPIEVDGVTETEKINIPNTIMGKWAGDKDIKIMRINGESMNKTMPHNSLIAVKPVELSNLKNDDIVVFSDDHEYSVKRYYDDKDNERIVFRPHSTDRMFIDNTFPYDNLDGLQIHGKVVLYIVESD